MALAAVNLWTGAPLLALWIGSRAVTTNRISMGAVALVAVSLLAISLALIWVLGTAAAAHDALSGRQATVRRHVPWLRSVRGERVAYEQARIGVNGAERVLVASVVLAVLAFEVWFFFFAGSPFDFVGPGGSRGG